MTASSGSNPVRMTSLQYGENITHVIRGVQVTGGSCTVSSVEATSAPAAYSILGDITYTPSSAYTFLQGGDISRLNQQITGGASYKENNSAKDMVQIAADNGWNIVRLRVYNDPGNQSYTPSKYMSPGFVNTADALRLAAKAKAKGLKVWLSFHYSDFWTNPGCQNIPHDWSGKNENQLKTAVYDFTKDVLQQMSAQGTLPEYVSIGNETNAGMLFGGGTDGTGQNSAYYTKYDKFVAFFNKGAQAVREVAPNAKIAVHFTNPQQSNVINSLCGYMRSYNADYDIIGISYYPFWTQTMTCAQFCSLADNVASTYHKDVMIMETAVNWNTVTYYNDAGQLTDQGAYESIYPAAKENQRNYLQELCNEIKKSSSVLGLLYWDPVTTGPARWKIF